MAKPKVVVASGRFDLIHKAHIRYLERAKAAGGPGAKLVVVVARDRLVKRETGADPTFDEKSRLYMIRTLKPVDRAVLGPSTYDLKWHKENNLETEARYHSYRIRPEVDILASKRGHGGNEMA